MKSILMFLSLITIISCGVNFKDPTSEKQNLLNSSYEGTDITEQFIDTYSGKFIDTETNENLVIDDNGKVRRTEVRQVSHIDTDLYVCNYILIGKILQVIERDLNSRKTYMDFATHVILVQYDDIKLSDDLYTTTSNIKCQNFLQDMKRQMLERKGIEYSYYTELLSDDSFRMHTSGGGDYKEGGPRTPSTLDEIYTRVQEREE